MLNNDFQLKIAACLGQYSTLHIPKMLKNLIIAHATVRDFGVPM